MAQDVARLIWEMAKADKTLDGLKLKEMFRRKVDQHADELITRLKDIVSERIKTEMQPHKAEIMLTSDNRAKEGAIFGGTSMSKSVTQPLVPPSQYCYHDSVNYFLVTNSETQFLISHAIIPLDLKWKIMSPGVNNNIVVSWRHWLIPEESQNLNK
jgi:hypothetical protein